MEANDVHTPGFTAVVLAAGRGSRMGTLTDEQPKCLLEVRPGYTILGLMLDRLLECPGIHRVLVVAGYRADLVEAAIEARGDDRVQMSFNPFFEVSNNLHSLWLVRDELREGGLIINGDDVFHPELLPQVVAAEGDIAVTLNRKDSYDDDDMKVRLEGPRLSRIGKDIPLAEAEGEAIGVIRLSPQGSSWLRQNMDALVRENELNCFYLRAIQRMIDEGHPVLFKDITPLPWAEVDDAKDLELLRAQADHFVPKGKKRDRSAA